MDIDKLKGLIILGSLSSIIGLILLLFSPNFGTSCAEIWLANQGGFADTSSYELIVKGYMNSFLATGSILLMIGLFTMLFTYYKMLQHNE